MPAIPSCTVDGAFGIARTTGTPSAMRALDVLGRDRRRDGEHRLLRRQQRADLGEQRVDVLRLHGEDDDAAPLTASAFDVVASTPCRSVDDALRALARASRS